MKKIKPLAFYLPQYHPIPENDEWWGVGFTEWTNVRKAKSLYEGHYQPLVPRDLGYYDLRDKDVRQRQVKLAQDAGIHGFIYYHYWFGNNRKLLEKVAEDVLTTGQPDFPFCFCWANESWSGVWHGLDKKILVEQTYPGEDDIKNHIEYLVPFFKDPRYIKVEGKPVFMVYDPSYIKKSKNYLDLYRKYAKQHGFEDLFIIGTSKSPDSLIYKELGYDAHISNAFHVSFNHHTTIWKRKLPLLSKIKRKGPKWMNSQNPVGPIVIPAEKVFDDMKIVEADVETYPMVVPNWDNTARSNWRGVVMEGASPELFNQQILKAKKYLDLRSDYKEKFLIIKSWNEWAEGNIMEPEAKYGSQFLEVVKNNLY